MALILVTGADGQLGRALRVLVGEPVEGWAFAGRDELDVTSRGDVERFFALHRPSVVVNLAAFTDVDRAETERDAAMAVNRDGARNLAEACLVANAALVHISTDFVFSGFDLLSSPPHPPLRKLRTRPYTETETPAPVNFYGESKLAGERAVAASGCRGAIVRTSWLWSDGAGFVAAILRKAAVQREIKVVADQTGTPTEARNLATALMKIVAGYNSASPHPPREEAASLPANSGAELFHFSGGSVMSRAEWARRIIEEAGLDCRVIEISSDEFPTAAKRPKFSALDSSKFAQRYGR